MKTWKAEGHKKLFLDKDSSDVTIIVYDESLLDKSKTFDCHKDISSWQNEVFKALLTGNTTVESSSGEVQITDVPVEGMEVLLRYLSHVSKEKINSDLMMAAKQLQCRRACQ